jgi:hypothetical protein
MTCLKRERDGYRYDEQVVPHIAIGILRLRRSHGRFSVGPPLKSKTLLYDSENDCLLRKNFTTRVWFSRLALAHSSLSADNPFP